MPSAPVALILIYLVLPLWLAAGVADWLCHRATHIELTAGPRESVLHLVMFAEVGLPLLAVLFLEINAAVIALMIVAFVVHEGTALWDVHYAISRRHVGAFEQQVHSFLELLPLIAIVCLVCLHWGQFLALFGAGPERAAFALRLKSQPLPGAFIVGLLLAVVLLELVPYGEELIRCLRGTPLRIASARAAGRRAGPAPWASPR